jgi:integrase family protein with SAM-like domain
MSKPHEHTNKLERGRKTAISENVIIDFIMLEKGIFWRPEIFTKQGTPNSSSCPFDRLRLQCQSVRWSFTKRVIPSSTIIAEVGPEVTETYIDFFTSTIRNRNTRQAYARACWQSFDWCAAHGLELTSVRPFHVAAWIEDFPGSKPTVKQKLAAVRMLYDFLVVRKITPSNPAHAVRGPKYVVKKGKTPVWSREDSKTLLDSILNCHAICHPCRSHSS